jgi:hypothetical protein
VLWLGVYGFLALYMNTNAPFIGRGDSAKVAPILPIMEPDRLAYPQTQDTPRMVRRRLWKQVGGI